VLAVGAHWDDIEIGCGLTFRKLKQQGANLFGVVITDSGYTVDKDLHIRVESKAYKEGIESFKMLDITHIETTLLPN